MIVGLLLIGLLTLTSIVSIFLPFSWVPTISLIILIVFIQQGRIKELVLSVIWIIFVSTPFTIVDPILLTIIYASWSILMMVSQRFFAQESMLQGVLGAFIWEFTLVISFQSFEMDQLMLHSIQLVSNIITLSIMVYYIYKYRINEILFETD